MILVINKSKNLYFVTSNIIYWKIKLISHKKYSVANLLNMKLETKLELYFQAFLTVW